MTEETKFDINKLKGFNDYKIEKVDVSDVWPDMGAIYIRSLTGTARDTFEMQVVDSNKGPKSGRTYNMRALLVVASACHADGKLIFSASDAEWLGGQSAKVLDRLFDKAQALSGMSDGDVEAMEKHLETDQS